MLTRTALQAILAQEGIAPLKRLGQNFLIDGNIKNKIIAAATVSPRDTVLEIGPGLGALTMDLAATGATVVAVEKDRKAAAILAARSEGRYPHLTIVHEDILTFDLSRLSADRAIVVIGNLPYYITTPIIEYLLERRHRIARALILIQREVAARLVAQPGSEEYGSLACFVQYFAKPSYLYTVKRTAFYPVPDVDSALIRLDMSAAPPVAVDDEGLFFRIVRGAFNQRRKSIVNSLSREAVLAMPKEAVIALCDRAGLDHAARPETLSLADFARLTNAIAREGGRGALGFDKR